MTERDRLRDSEPDIDAYVEFAAPCAPDTPKHSNRDKESTKPTKTRSRAKDAMSRRQKCLETDACGHECARPHVHKGEHGCTSCLGRRGGRPSIESVARTKRFVVKITPMLAQKLRGKDCSSAVRAVLEQIASGAAPAFSLDITEIDAVE